MSPERAVAAMFANQASWLAHMIAGASWPDGNAVATPEYLILAGSRAVAITARDPDRLDAALAWLRARRVGNVTAWSATPDPGTDLQLHARGFRESFAPRWMWHDLGRTDASRPDPTNLTVAVATRDDRDAYTSASSVPYVNPNQAGGLFDRVIGDRRRSMLILARDPGGAVCGTGFLHLTHHEGHLVGGIYNLAVDPAWRGKGIGAALTIGLLRHARDRGAVGAALNATGDGERLYRRLGFMSTGDGATWFLPESVLDRPPSRNDVAAAEALGRRDSSMLDPVVARWETMPDGESPVRFAARFGQREAIGWLLGHGASPDIAPLWSTGYREAALHAMRDPSERDRLRGIPGATALHDAVLLDDTGLVQALLGAGADLTVRDGQWLATPLDWARVLGRTGLLALLEAAGAT